MIKISVITPCLNAETYLANAIESVFDQDHDRFEHVVIDGGSTDGTVEVLKKYKHLKWISEIDSGQPEAMNKGFAMSSGEIIVYLNADDYFLSGAFQSVIPFFEKGANFVMGNVKVLNLDGSYWINSGSNQHEKMLRHWEPEAFCVNPVGYFYRREVQRHIGDFNPENHYAMDLEFLLAASQHYEIEKIDKVLGTFRYFPGTKTKDRETEENVFTRSNFRFLDDFLKEKPNDYMKAYRKDQEAGYMKRNKSL